MKKIFMKKRIILENETSLISEASSDNFKALVILY